MEFVSWPGQLGARPQVVKLGSNPPSLFGIYGEQSSSGTSFSPSTFVSFQQYLSTSAPNSFIHLSVTLYNLSM